MNSLFAVRLAHAWTGRILMPAALLTLLFVLSACALPLTPQPEAEGVDLNAALPVAAPAGESGEADTEAETAVDSATDAGTNAESAMPVDPDQEIYNGIPVGFTEEGFPYRGSLDAPVVMYEYSDYQCPFCQRYFVQTEPAMDESFVRDGTLRVVFRDFPLEQLHPNAPAAHEASLCVADQGVILYWDMHAELFRTQQEWSQDPESAAFFAGLAEQVGADMDLYAECMDSGVKQAMVADGIAEAREYGFSGTPSFRFVNRESGDSYNLVGAQPYDSFAGFVTAIAAGEAPAEATAEEGSGEEGEIPFWATADGLTPDPERPGFTTAGDFYRGNPDAAVVVVEYSDFQCPYCKRHADTTQPVLDEQFVETDQVLWVFKHFPLTIHPQAPQAGAAAECLAEQELFWDGKNLLFDSVNQWGVSDPIPELIDIVANSDLDVDMDAFESCINGEEALAAVDSDMADGAPFVRGTPTFIVLYNGQGRIIPGALPVERFTEVIQQALDEAGGTN